MSKMIPTWITKDLKKYTFVNDARVKGTYLHIDYVVDGHIKTKRVARRVALKALQQIVANIKQEVGETNEEGYRGNYHII